MVYFLSNWIFIAFIAYFFQAASAVADKFLLEKRVPRPSTYAFWVGGLGFLSLNLAPWGFFIPDFKTLIWSLVSGFISIGSFYSIFYLLQKGEVSRILPVIGGFSPVFVLLLSRFFLAEELGRIEFLSFLLLIAGGILISPRLKNDSAGGKSAGTRKIFFLAVFSAFLYAFTYFSFKIAASHTPFINAFIWSRLGGFLTSLLFLVPPGSRRAIFDSLGFKKNKDNIVFPETSFREENTAVPGISKGYFSSTPSLFVIGKILSSVGFFLLNYAVALGRVSLVNAMQGVEYALLFIFTVVLSRYFPSIIKEETGVLVVFQKILGITLIAFGLWVLAMV